jgi:hypothetical protein
MCSSLHVLPRLAVVSSCQAPRFLPTAARSTPHSASPPPPSLPVLAVSFAFLQLAPLHLLTHLQDVCSEAQEVSLSASATRVPSLQVRLSLRTHFFTCDCPSPLRTADILIYHTHPHTHPRPQATPASAQTRPYKNTHMRSMHTQTKRERKRER